MLKVLKFEEDDDVLIDMDEILLIHPVKQQVQGQPLIGKHHCNISMKNGASMLVPASSNDIIKQLGQPESDLYQ